MSATLVIDAAYGWVLFDAVIIAAQAVLTGIHVGGERRRLFNKAFFEKNFPELKGNYPKGGYPDVGSGRFSDKLSFEDWLSFNNAQRAHQNFLEGIATILTLLLVSGLFYPRLAAIAGVAYIIGREIYTYSYRKFGPNKRLLGAIIFDIVLLVLLVASLCGAWNLGGGLSGLLGLLKF